MDKLNSDLDLLENLSKKISDLIYNNQYSEISKIDKQRQILINKIKEKFNIKQSAKDLLITSQLRSALIFNDKIKATNYQIDTYKRKIYIYGIAMNSEGKNLVVQEAKEILDVENVIASILLVEDLRIKKN